MIRLGYDDAAKDATITAYCAAHAIRKVFVLSPAKFRFSCSTPHEIVEWADIIEYRFYYRLLREIDQSTLIVINECLRTQNRHELAYNCIPLFLQQTGHQVVFQYLPLIESPEDFMILFDFDTRSQLPVVVLPHDMSKRMAATVQFNKARGVHQVDLDADVVRSLIEQGVNEAEIAAKLGMDLEAVHRYKQITGVAELFRNTDYSMSWEIIEEPD